MNKKSFFVIIPLVVLCICTGTSKGQSSFISQQIDQLFAEWNKSDMPGAAVAVLQDGKIVFKKGYGCANLEYGIPNSPSTVFHIASTSKQFTAFAVLLLENEGKLFLDDDVRKYIPELPDFGNNVTLRQLIYHTSGYRDQWELISMAGWRMDDVITRDQLLNLVTRQKELNFVPGAEYDYSNTGYMLLAEVVSRVSGKSFADFTRERIFKPLQMNNTLFYDDHEKIVKNRAYSYYFDGTDYKKNNLNYANVGATSLLTTVEDMCKWAMNFEKPLVGNARIINEMNTQGVLNNGDTITYAMGQDKIKYKGLICYNHGGADAGYRAVFGRLPDQHFSVVVLSNLASFDPSGMAIKITDLYLRDKYVEEKPVANKPSPDTANEFSGDPTLLKSYCGVYQLRPGFDINVFFENNRLFVETHEVPKTQLIQVSSSDFTIPDMHAKISFAAAANTTINRMIIDLNGRHMIADKKVAFDPTTVNLNEYTGNYYSPELGTTYTFNVKNGNLIMKQVRMGEHSLNAVKQDLFTGNIWFLNEFSFLRDGNLKVNGFRLSGVNARNIVFGKIP